MRLETNLRPPQVTKGLLVGNSTGANPKHHNQKQKSTMKLSKTEQIRLIEKAYYKLAYACEHTNKWDKFVALVEEEEKGHRRFCPDGLRCGLSKAQAVRLFCVKEVFGRFVPEHTANEAIYTPEAKDFFMIKHSVFGACAIADKCKTTILKAFTLPEMREWLDSVDYVKLNEDPRAPRQAMQEVA